MPLYDYQCKKCQAVFEVRATFKEKEAGLEPECPQCHTKKTHQLLTAACSCFTAMALQWRPQPAADEMPGRDVVAVKLVL